MLITFEDVENALSRAEPSPVPEGGGTPAAVAMILRERQEGMEVLFIERASHENDPWSGNIGFPGGKVEDSDSDARGAAERETKEEVGLDLGWALYLGHLSEVSASTLPVRVSCFVYGIVDESPLEPSEEVGDVFWVPLSALVDSRNHGESVVSFAGRTYTRPAIKLPQAGKPVLWGLTYRFVMEFLELLLPVEQRLTNYL